VVRNLFFSSFISDNDCLNTQEDEEKERLARIEEEKSAILIAQLTRGSPLRSPSSATGYLNPVGYNKTRLFISCDI